MPVRTCFAELVGSMHPCLQSPLYSRPTNNTNSKQPSRTLLHAAPLSHSPTAWGGDINPAASGRPLVRLTCLSKLRSHKSFTVQPAPRSRTAPVPNSASMRRSGREPGGAASAIDQKQGQARSHVPATDQSGQLTRSCKRLQTSLLRIQTPTEPRAIEVSSSLRSSMLIDLIMRYRSRAPACCNMPATAFPVFI